tara:strand:+ start:12921 stop:13271 length:351 start_codon:yes stop_codon:yes gene_type:complete
MLKFFILLLVCQLAGEVLIIASGAPLPGPVVGMGLLLAGLLLRNTLPPDLDTMANGLLSHLSLLFVPAGVGVILHIELISDELIPITASLILSTLITLVVTAGLMQVLSKRQSERG